MFLCSPMSSTQSAVAMLIMAISLSNAAFGADATWRISMKIAKELEEKGEYGAAALVYERAVDRVTQANGPDDLDTADAMECLANMHRKMSLLAKAEKLHQRCLKIREAKLGPNHPDIAISLNNLGNVYSDMVHYAQAEECHQRSLKIREAKLGPDDPDVAQSLNNLASLYGDMGQYALAEEYQQRSLKIRQSKFGPDHPVVADSLNNLGNLYCDMGHYAQAEECHQRGLKIREAKLGPEHPDVAQSLGNLAELYRNMGQYSRAEALLQRSLKIRESKFGSSHPAVAVNLSELAGIYHELRQYERQEPLLQRSLEIYESALGADHPGAVTRLHYLAIMYDNMRQYDKAEPLYQRALAARESKFGPDHPLVADILNNFATMYQNTDQCTQAEAMHHRSLKIREAVLGTDHPDVAQTLSNQARCHAIMGRWAEAATETDRMRRIVRRHVSRVLPILSEQEQLVFLQTQDELRWHIALSLGLRQRADAAVAEQSAGWILNGKAVAQESLAQRSFMLGEGIAPPVAKLATQLRTVRSQLAALNLKHPERGADAEQRQQLETLKSREEDLSRQFGQATGRQVTGDPWVEVAAVRRALPENALLIEVARHRVYNFAGKSGEKWGATRYVAWLIPAANQGAVTIVDLGEADRIDEAVGQARQALQKAVKVIRAEGEAAAEKQLSAAMGNITRLVLEPLEKHFGNARQLIVSPDAALWLVPWGALPLADGTYAIEKYPIRYVISGRDLVRPAAKNEYQLQPAALFADPDYDLTATAADAATQAALRKMAPLGQVASSHTVRSLRGLAQAKRLPGTAAEAAAIKPSITRYTGVEAIIYQNQNALEGVFKAMHQPRVLVLSTHGFFLPDQEVATNDQQASGETRSGAPLTTHGQPLENPLLRCGLLLAGCNRRADPAAAFRVDDGILTGLEIVGTDLVGTELVVLSACETGLGQVRNGEGVAGLRQAFQLAGAKAVISTLWQIPDEETVHLMNAFFTYLATGQSKADALRYAQLALIQSRRQDRLAAHPFYWAAFTLTGE